MDGVVRLILWGLFTLFVGPQVKRPLDSFVDRVGDALGLLRGSELHIHSPRNAFDPWPNVTKPIKQAVHFSSTYTRCSSWISIRP